MTESKSDSCPVCPTLCDPMDCSLPGSSDYWNSSDKNTGLGGHGFLQGIFPTQGSNSVSSIAADSLPSEPPGLTNILSEVTCPQTHRGEKLLPFPLLDCFFQHRSHTVENYGVIPISHSCLANTEKIDRALHHILSSTFLS